MTTTKATEARGAVFVAAGILISRVAGLVRLRAFAHYFGLNDLVVADGAVEAVT